MVRFCFKTVNEDVIETLKEYYNRVDVEFKLKPNEDNSFDGCVVLKNYRDREIFMNLTNNIPQIEGLVQYPTYLPHWNHIRQNGPYMVPDPKFLGAKLYSKDRKDTVYDLNTNEEKYARLFVPYILSNDTLFRQNFWTDFKKLLKKDQPFQTIDEIVWTDLQIKMDREQSDATIKHEDLKKHSQVEIDGKIYTVTPFAIDNASIFLGYEKNDNRRGMIKKSIDHKDVIVNISPQYIDNTTAKFKTVHVPDVNWAAKWTQPITKEVRFMNILFGDGKDDPIIEHYSDAEDEDLEGEVFGYDEDENENENENEDQEDGAVNVDFIDVDPITHVVAEEYIPDYLNLDETESLLPMTYIVPGFEQWSYALDACKSNFKVVKNLGKVNNSTLKLIADAASVSNMKIVNAEGRGGNLSSLHLTKQIETNNDWIKYARQRNV